MVLKDNPMIFDRKQQRLLLEGKEYAFEDISRLIAGGAEAHSPASWDLYLFLNEWFNDSPVITVHTSGSTGTPKELIVRKDQMMQSARLTCEFLDLKKGETALLCMNLRYIGAMMVVVRGAIDEALEAEIKHLPTAAYSTYGMTETLSHIALRRLNGTLASEHYYPFSSVKLSLSVENTLVIDAPLVCDEILQTNDIAHIYPDGSFMILGRKDNVINSGGIKIQAEEMEKLLRPFIPVPFVITSVPDQRLGQAVTLLIVGQLDTRELENKLQTTLEPYYRPKHIFITKFIPQTENGKIDRVGCRTLALSHLSHSHQFPSIELHDDVM